MEIGSGYGEASDRTHCHSHLIVKAAPNFPPSLSIYCFQGNEESVVKKGIISVQGRLFIASCTSIIELYLLNCTAKLLHFCIINLSDYNTASQFLVDF